MFYSKERRLKRRTQRALKELIDLSYINGGYDLLNLVKRNFVTVTAWGVDISAINLWLFNNIEHEMSVYVKPGIILTTNKPFQNMVITYGKLIHISENGFNSLNLDNRLSAACAQAYEAIPTKNDKFEKLTFNETLYKFLSLANKYELEYLTIQAGVWAITDNLSGEQLLSRLQSNNNSSNIITYDNIRQASKLLSELKIRCSITESEY